MDREMIVAKAAYKYSRGALKVKIPTALEVLHENAQRFFSAIAKIFDARLFTLGAQKFVDCLFLLLLQEKNWIVKFLGNSCISQSYP